MASLSSLSFRFARETDIITTSEMVAMSLLLRIVSFGKPPMAIAVMKESVIMMALLPRMRRGSMPTEWGTVINGFREVSNRIGEGRYKN